MENYRKIYEKYCNIKIPKGYVIHHIDGNRENNDIRNLVMLPNELHKKYHEILTRLETKFVVNKRITSIYESGSGINEYSSTIYIQFINTIKQCNKYVDYRDYLLGLIPNIHNLNVGDDLWKNNTN